MADTTEHHIALREAHQIAASDSFFAARKELRDTEHERYIFDAGFRRGFDAHESLQRKPTATPPADAALAELALYLDRMADRVRTDVMDCARLRQAAAALRARSAPAYNLTEQDTADIARVLCWLKHGDTPPAAEIERIVHRNAELRGIVDDLRARAVPAFVPYTDSELRQWYPVMCNTCGWRGLSRDCTGGGHIADTGDFNEITCPKCWNEGEGKAVSPREVVVLEPAQAVADGFVVITAAWFDREIPRIDAGGANPITPDEHCCEWVLYQERERIHLALSALLAASKVGGE